MPIPPGLLSKLQCVCLFTCLWRPTRHFTKVRPDDRIEAAWQRSAGEIREEAARHLHKIENTTHCCRRILDRLVHNVHRIEMRGDSMHNKPGTQPSELMLTWVAATAAPFPRTPYFASECVLRSERCSLSLEFPVLPE